MMEPDPREDEFSLKVLENQVGGVLDAIRRKPHQVGQFLSMFISNFFEAVKETIRAQGYVTPLYVMLADPVSYGSPPVTEEVLKRAEAVEAAAVVSVEGFQSNRDIGDVIYHVSMSAKGVGVMGWVLQVRLEEEKITFEREMPYHFDAMERVKTLGELIEEMERG